MGILMLSLPQGEGELEWISADSLRIHLSERPKSPKVMSPPKGNLHLMMGH